MRPVRVQIQPLLETLNKNRTQHRAVFEEALEGYRKEAIRVLDGHIAELKSGKPKRVYVSVPYPEDHTADYDAAIGLLNLSVDDFAELDEASYKCFVLDDWNWKRQWAASNSGYVSAQTAKSLDEFN